MAPLSLRSFRFFKSALPDKPDSATIRIPTGALVGGVARSAQLLGRRPPREGLVMGSPESAVIDRWSEISASGIYVTDGDDSTG